MNIQAHNCIPCTECNRCKFCVEHLPCVELQLLRLKNPLKNPFQEKLEKDKGLEIL